MTHRQQKGTQQRLSMSGHMAPWRERPHRSSEPAPRKRWCRSNLSDRRHSPIRSIKVLPEHRAAAQDDGARFPERSDGTDLRHFLNRSKQVSLDPIKICITGDSHGQRKIFKQADTSLDTFKLRVGNLTSPVEKEDLYALFEPYGHVGKVKLRHGHALVFLQSSKLKADEAVQQLHLNHWMDNQIHVYLDLDQIGAEREHEPTPPHLESSDLETKKIQLRHFQLAMSAPCHEQFVKDMVDIFLKYGTVRSYDLASDGKILCVALYSSQQEAANCVKEVAEIRYASQKVQVSILDDASIPLAEEAETEASVAPVEHCLPTVDYDAANYSGVQGYVESVSNKFVLIRFFNGLARLVPGNMYVGGRHCLGYIIKNNSPDTWPFEVRRFLSFGSRVRMDVKRLADICMSDTQPTPEPVAFSASLVWREDVAQPTEAELTITLESILEEVLKGIVVTLFPTWGILKTKRGQVLFLGQHFYLDNGAGLSDQSLLSHLSIGDLVAVYCRPMSPFRASEMVRLCTGFKGSSNQLTCSARLVWRLSSELNPFSKVTTSEHEIECRFLNTSSTLLQPLPSKKAPLRKGLQGIVQQLHLPAGGLIRLVDSELSEEWQSMVYFHRSRLYMDDTKIHLTDCLSTVLLPGDHVEVDVVPNTVEQLEVSSEQGCYIDCQAHWVAMAVRMAAADQGVALAKALRMEQSGRHQDNESVGVLCSKARIIWLRAPDVDPLAPCTSGVAVIESGPFAGQRVEFERKDCLAFGYSLHAADLSLLLSMGLEVEVEVKEYNSYCVHALWLGGRSTPAKKDIVANIQFRQFLFNCGLDEVSFQSVLRGQARAERPFLPLPSTIYSGNVKCLIKSDRSPDGSADMLEVDAGDQGFTNPVYVHREHLYVYGHCMAKADLSYIINQERLFFQMFPVFEGKENQACLAWMGSETQRPRYSAPDTNLLSLPADTHSLLWYFVRSKGMDEPMFRNLVQGRLGPKNVIVAEPGQAADQREVEGQMAAKAAILQTMKDKFGSSPACLDAVRFLLNGKTESPDQRSPE